MQLDCANQCTCLYKNSARTWKSRYNLYLRVIYKLVEMNFSLTCVDSEVGEDISKVHHDCNRTLRAFTNVEQESDSLSDFVQEDALANGH